MHSNEIVPARCVHLSGFLFAILNNCVQQCAPTCNSVRLHELPTTWIFLVVVNRNEWVSYLCTVFFPVERNLTCAFSLTRS